MTSPSLNNWLFVEISKTANSPNDSSTLASTASLLASQIAQEKSFWTTQLRVQLGANHWLIGQPNQARYWTKSKARLMALQLNEVGLFAANSEH